MKKSLAVMLALIMVLCMIPTTAFAANGTGHQISVNIYKVVLDSSKPLGYQTPELVKNITVTCQDGTAHSGYNHFVNLKEFYPTKFGLSTKDWTGWQFDSYYTKGKDNKTFYNWTKDTVNATANVTGSEPYPCSKNFYLVYKEAAPQTQDITLTYDANEGTGAPEPQTQTVESGKEATFTVNSKEPTRTNYDFKGWSTDKNATTASYHGGESIKISKDTTLYAVWANHEHKDENGDGYCDTDHECMHEKDQDGYCIVDGCTHPHEGDGACCPKKSGNKPERPEPENTTKPVVGLTGKEAVTVHCTNDKANHDDKSYGLMHDGYTVGNVKGDATSGYTCEITVEPAKYVAQYNLDINVEHKLDSESQPGKINLEWDGSEWKVVNGVPVVFNVKCDKTQPENPAELTSFVKSRVTVTPDNMSTLPEGVTFNTDSTVTFNDNSTTANLLYSFTVTGTPGAKVTITDTGAKFYNGTDWNTADIITVTLPAESITDYATYTVYGYRQFTKDNIINGALTNTATAGVEGSEKLVPGEATVPAEDKTGSGPSESPNPSPSTEPTPTPTPTPGGGNGGGGHSHYYPTTTPVPVIVIPPKTGDMTIWQNILHFLGIR